MTYKLEYEPIFRFFALKSTQITLRSYSNAIFEKCSSERLRTDLEKFSAIIVIQSCHLKMICFFFKY